MLKKVSIVFIVGVVLSLLLVYYGFKTPADAIKAVFDYLYFGAGMYMLELFDSKE